MKTTKNAYDMFARNLTAFSQQYSVLLKKYQDIVDKEIAAEFPQVTSDLKSVKPNGSLEYQYIANKFFTSTDNLANILKAANRPNLAPAFAFAEFALKEDLTASLTLDLARFHRCGVVQIPAINTTSGSISSVILISTTAMGCMFEL